MSKINYLGIDPIGKNYVSYDDSDLMTDYYHGYSVKQTETAQEIKDNGANVIDVYFTNESIEECLQKDLKRIQKIAKDLSEYTFSIKTEVFPYKDTEGVKERIKIKGLLIKNS